MRDDFSMLDCLDSELTIDLDTLKKPEEKKKGDIKLSKKFNRLEEGDFDEDEEEEESSLVTNSTKITKKTILERADEKKMTDVQMVSRHKPHPHS
jgi:hypothetical protein